VVRRGVYRGLVEKSEKKKQLEHLDMNGSIVLKKNINVGFWTWTRLIWLMTRTGGGFL
jgi:hypothetical protein